MAALAISAAQPHATGAQASAMIPRVRGFAFDSLRGKPLADEFIAIVGGNWSTTSDSAGRFSFENVPSGSYVVIMQHAALDTLGFQGIPTRIRLADSSSQVRVSVPSFSTLWRSACSDAPAPADSGFIYGVVRDAVTDRVVPNALISVVWYDSIGSGGDSRMTVTGKTDDEAINRRQSARKGDVAAPTQSWDSRYGQLTRAPTSAGGGAFVVTPWRSQSRSDSTGTYAICSVPLRGLGPRVVAETATASSDTIDFAISPRVLRRDIRMVQGTSGSVGVVAGQLTDTRGQPVPFARVLIEGAGEARTDEKGHFTLRDVAVGTRRLEILFIGMTPTRTTVDVTANDTANVTFALNRIPTLAGMNVKAATLGRVVAAEFESRRKLGVGYVADSTLISGYTSVANALRDVPSLELQRGGASLTASVSDGHGGKCTPTVWLDGVEASYGNLLDLTPSEVAGLEVYTRPLMVPTAFREKGVDRKCGAIIVWTRYLFKNR